MATSKPSTAGKSAKATKKTAKPTSKPSIADKSAKATTKKTKPTAAASEPVKITPKQALANTLALLKAKKEKARQPANYPTGGAVHPGSLGAHGVGAAQSETASTQRLTEAIHGHPFATETGDESKRSQS
jgi:hypothetical protein